MCNGPVHRDHECRAAHPQRAQRNTIENEKGQVEKRFGGTEKEYQDLRHDASVRQKNVRGGDGGGGHVKFVLH